MENRRYNKFHQECNTTLEHRRDINNETEWLARAIATACLGNNHLWQDLGLPNRQTLSDILEINFTTLFEKNIGNMKMKKFFYKQLCESIGVHVCKAPSCGVCRDYAKCFGPEDASPATPLNFVA
ncbi:MAG: nitrogen fixation protein NifQ [Gammaproteobacteria bacterium]